LQFLVLDVLAVDCGFPVLNSPVVANFSSTTEGSVVTFQCINGVIPSLDSSTCGSSGQWEPDTTIVQCNSGLVYVV